jgi:hypothetical protein
MSTVIIEDGGMYTHDPSDSKVYLFDWDTNNLASTVTIDTSKIKLRTLRGTVLEQTVSSITLAGGTATVTMAAAHGYATGDYITISGADPTGGPTPSPYNGTFQITKTGATTFTYAVTGAPASPATVDAKESAIVAVKGFDNVTIPALSRTTQFRFTLPGNYEGSLFEIANLIVTDETPAQGKERSFQLLIQQK